MTIAVVGSRDFDGYNYLSKSLEIYFPTIDKIISGGARGADSLAARYAKEHDIPLIEFLPDWDRYGKSAGFKRNQQIVDATNVVVAYWDGKSHGTKHSINIADALQKPVLIFLYEQKQIITLNWKWVCGGMLK